MFRHFEPPPSSLLPPPPKKKKQQQHLLLTNRNLHLEWRKKRSTKLKMFLFNAHILKNPYTLLLDKKYVLLNRNLKLYTSPIRKAM